MKNKKIVMFLITCMVLIPMMTGCGKKEVKNNNVEPQANTKTGITKDQTVGDLIIKRTALVYTNGTSKLTTTVTNNSAKDVYVGSFDIIFKDSTGKETARLLGYIGSNVKAGESKTLTTEVDQNLMSAATVEYSLRNK